MTLVNTVHKILRGGIDVRVGIMTLFHENYNYGAALQAYALQKAIESLGNDVEVLDYDRTAEPIDSVDNSISGKIKRKLGSIESYGDVYNLMHLFSSKSRYLPSINERKRKFKEFYQKNLKVSRYYNLGTIYSANSDYDAFVCGSDQVWRPGSFDPNYYLTFAALGKKKISYAASLGVQKLSRAANKMMVPLIEKLDAVSVREPEAAKILRKCGVDALVTLDPTLLWDRAFWENVATNTDLENGKYILCYFIGENNSNREIAKQIAKIKGLPLVAIPGISRLLPYDFKYADRNMVEAGPDEFLGMVRDAAVVVTDSFHACVFSTIFEVPFVAVERFSAKDANSMNGRVYDFLTMFGLERQLVRKGDVIEPTILEGITPRISEYENLKECSWRYLRENLPYDFVSNNTKIDMPKAVYAAQSTDVEKRKNSSSGGVFYELAKKTLSEGGVVVACKLDDRGKAIHDVCETRYALPQFMTSKYVQSDMQDALKLTEEKLKNGRTVLFVGTPCQAAGLKSYLEAKKINTDGLLCLDIICHGVPSPYVWQEYLNGVVKSERVEPIRANFRHKFYGWRKYAVSIETAYSKIYLRDKDNDLYLRGFLNNIFLRPSCYHCRFKTLMHNTDLTLGDFWHFEQFNSTIKDDDTGVSLVIAQSEKGEKTLKSLDEVYLDPMPIEVVSKSNKNMFLSARNNYIRDIFFANYAEFKRTYDDQDTMQKYLNSLIGDTVVDKVKKLTKKIMGR